MTENYAIIVLLAIVASLKATELPGSCKPGQYLDPGVMTCLSCSANSSMVTSPDGFSCTCTEHSVPAGVSKCRPCNATEVVSSDRRSCVPRRCQGSGGRLVCRKCPNDYISVTQNFDGSPMKEVQCVKCTRGYKAQNNVCVRCEACACAKLEIVLRGRCVAKRFITDRPKHSEVKLHPNKLLDIVKHEYFCTQNDLLACRELADLCVRGFYTTDAAGPCRFWIQAKFTQPGGLPALTMEINDNENPTEIGLSKGMDTLHLVMAVFTANGGLKLLYGPDENFKCSLPFKIRIGNDYSIDCKYNVSELESSLYETLSPFLLINGELKVLPIAIRKPDGKLVEKGSWATNKFKRYFLIDNSLTLTANVTNVVYLKNLLIRLRIERSKFKSTSLRLHVYLEAQYAIKSPLHQSIVTSLKITHDMPSAGIFRGLEVWGGVLGAMLSLYAGVQWRGVLRRGGLHCTLVPLLGAAVADSLYFAAWFSTLYALAAEAGTLGMTLPLSHSEDRIIKSFIYSAVCLKALKLAWINWNQCRSDIFFLDWSEYNSPLKERPSYDKIECWRAATLAREWSRLQAVRRAPPTVTVTLALLILHLLQPWQIYVPQNVSYKWAISTLAWWCAYILVVAVRWLVERVKPTTAVIGKVCTNVGMSLLIFQEEFYAHYVHGRNDESDARSLVGPLSTCRVVCAPQLRAVYKQLYTPGLVSLGEKDSRKVLLSKFLAAFFERALDGLSWVASERTLPERLLDVELVAREAGNTSALLYDPDDSQPSCFNVTWWGEEWTLGTFDAMLFGAVMMLTNNALTAILTTLVVWQVNKSARCWFGNRNQVEKTEVDVMFRD